MMHNSYQWGMHLGWWLVWAFLLFWIFVIPYNIPGQRAKRESPLDMLKKRFASGQIDKEEYLAKKSIIEA